jgi:RNAse (barnase) inhibitor barstar
MKEIKLDTSTWRARNDFYNALLPALGAPSLHGRNLDALNDSLGDGDINQIKPPFHITNTSVASVAAELLSYLKSFAKLVDDLRSAEALTGNIHSQPAAPGIQ